MAQHITCNATVRHLLPVLLAELALVLSEYVVCFKYYLVLYRLPAYYQMLKRADSLNNSNHIY